MKVLVLIAGGKKSFSSRLTRRCDLTASGPRLLYR
jgi:hypothetical protein